MAPSGFELDRGRPVENEPAPKPATTPSAESVDPRWFETAISAIVESVNDPAPVVVAVLLRVAARKLATVNPIPQRCRNAALLFFRMACIEAHDAAPPLTPEMVEAYRSEIERVAARRRKAA